MICKVKIHQIHAEVLYTLVILLQKSHIRMRMNTDLYHTGEYASLYVEFFLCV